MSVDISFGGVCRDISLLPTGEAEFESLFDALIAPAVYQDLRKNYLMATGQGTDTTRAADIELKNRGCEVGGSVSIHF